MQTGSADLAILPHPVVRKIYVPVCFRMLLNIPELPDQLHVMFDIGECSFILKKLCWLEV